MELVGYVAIWLVLAIAVGEFADRKGLNHLRWFGVALVISPLIAFVIVALMPPAADMKHFRTCPFCAEPVRIEARACRYCSRDLPALAS